MLVRRDAKLAPGVDAPARRAQLQPLAVEEAEQRLSGARRKRFGS